MGAPISQREKLLGLQLETTPGTANYPSSPITAHVFNVTAGPTDLLPNQRQPALGLAGTAPRSVGMVQGTLNFSIALASGDAFLTTVMPMLGYALDTGLWSPATAFDDMQTGSAKVWEGGRVKKLYGLMLTACTIAPDNNAGSRVVATCTAQGIWDGTEDEAMPSHTRTARDFYQAKGISFQMGGSAYAGGKIGMFNLNLNPASEAREDLEDDTALAHWLLTDRTPQFEIDPEAVLVATQDVYGKLLAGELTAITLTLNDGADTPSTLAITMAEAQRITVDDSTRGQKLTDAETFECHHSTLADAADGIGDDVTFQETAGA